MSHNGGIRTCSCDSCQQWRENEETEHRQLADDAERYEAIRQTVNCPTCNGDECFHEERIVNGDPCEVITGNCPDCTDGKIPMARLFAVGAAVFNASYVTARADYWDVNGKHVYEGCGRMGSLIHELRAVKPLDNQFGT